ncbi:unnamed protein product [Prunus armeniaca]
MASNTSVLRVLKKIKEQPDTSPSLCNIWIQTRDRRVTSGTGSSPMTGFSQEFLSYGEKANVEAPAVTAQGRHLRKDALLHGLLEWSQFHATHCDRLPSSTASHAHLVSEEKAVWLSEKRNLPFTAKSGVIVGEFSKLRKKLEKQSPHDAGRSIVQENRKREEDSS